MTYETIFNRTNHLTRVFTLSKGTINQGAGKQTLRTEHADKKKNQLNGTLVPQC
jgi:hypothetical protein